MADEGTSEGVALVTGGARRVGRAVALRLARAGMDIAITYNQSEDAACSLVEEVHAHGRDAAAIPVALERTDAADRVAEGLFEHFDRVDALVNNASHFEPSRFGTIDTAHFDRQMAINGRAPLMLMQRLAPALADGADPEWPESLGRIVNFIDIHVLGEPLPGYMAYNGAKALLYEATKTGAMELAPHITVNAIAPGVVAWAPDYTEQMKRDYMRRVPLQRPGTPEDAAEAVEYLVRRAHYCTGQVIRLDGGRFLT